MEIKTIIKAIVYVSRPFRNRKWTEPPKFSCSQHKGAVACQYSKRQQVSTCGFGVRGSCIHLFWAIRRFPPQLFRLSSSSSSSAPVGASCSFLQNVPINFEPPHRFPRTERTLQCRTSSAPSWTALPWLVAPWGSGGACVCSPPADLQSQNSALVALSEGSNVRNTRSVGWFVGVKSASERWSNRGSCSGKPVCSPLRN